LTAVVELDGAVDVEPIVDLHVDHRSRFFDEGSEATTRSTYKVEGRVDVQRRRSGRRLATTSTVNVNVFARMFPASSSSQLHAGSSPRAA
jgi:hypothetical protein